MIKENPEISAASEMNGQPLLQIKDLHVWYELKRFGFGHAGYVRAVDDVTFDLKQGQAIACVGESGCGKSSLMKTILGLNIPTRGDVIFDDTSLSTPGAKTSVSIGRRSVMSNRTPSGPCRLS